MAGGLDDMTATEKLAFANSVIATVSGDLASYAPILAADMTAMGTARDNFGDSILDSDQKRDASKAATVTRNSNDKILTDLLRSLRDRIKAEGVAEDKYAALGFPSGGPSGESSSSATIPIATVDTSKRLQHTINFADASAPNSKRRPRGVTGLEIYVKIDGTPPGNETECQFLGLDTQTPYLAEYPPEHAGKTAHYLFRWLFTDGTKSAFGETVSATITG